MIKRRNRFYLEQSGNWCFLMEIYPATPAETLSWIDFFHEHSEYTTEWGKFIDEFKEGWIVVDKLKSNNQVCFTVDFVLKSSLDAEQAFDKIYTYFKKPLNLYRGKDYSFKDFRNEY